MKNLHYRNVLGLLEAKLHSVALSYDGHLVLQLWFGSIRCENVNGKCFYSPWQQVIHVRTILGAIRQTDNSPVPQYTLFPGDEKKFYWKRPFAGPPLRSVQNGLIAVLPHCLLSIRDFG